MTQLDARFEPDLGAPAFTEAYDLRHYHIVLSVRDAPPHTYVVIYDLDESYVPPQISSQAAPDFSANLTSYGDYEVRARLYGSDSTLPLGVEGRLGALLRRHYGEGGALQPEVATAIDYIEQR